MNSFLLVRNVSLSIYLMRMAAVKFRTAVSVSIIVHLSRPMHRSESILNQILRAC
jgi:hypothetical protein